MFYNHIHIQTHAEHNQTQHTNLNERTHFLTKIYLLHPTFERDMLAVYERRAEDGDRLLYWPSSTSFSSWLGLLNQRSLRAQSPLSGAGSQLVILSPTDVFFKIPKFSAHRFWAWHHSHSSRISYLGFIMTIVIVISSAHERRLYPMSVHLN